MNNELNGGIKNALERGESMQKIKQSFLNAGYSLEEVENATRNLSVKKPKLRKFKKKKQQNLPEIKHPEKIKKGLSKTVIIILIVSSALVLIGALLLGLFI
jgi:hypothetical protein